MWDIHVTVPKSLFFANEGFEPFALGASKPGEVRAVFPSFVKDHLHRSPTSRAVRQPLRSQRIKQKVLVGSHDAASIAARITTAEAPDSCCEVAEGSICRTCVL